VCQDQYIDACQLSHHYKSPLTELIERLKDVLYEKSIFSLFLQNPIFEGKVNTLRHQNIECRAKTKYLLPVARERKICPVILQLRSLNDSDGWGDDERKKEGWVCV